MPLVPESDLNTMHDVLAGLIEDDIVLPTTANARAFDAFARTVEWHGGGVLGNLHGDAEWGPKGRND